MVLTGCMNIYSQQSFDLYGLINNGSAFRLNSLESNSGNYSLTKDWEFSMVYGSIFGNSNVSAANSIYLVSLAKRFSQHYIYARYTPGYIQEFIYQQGITATSEDSLLTLRTHLSYEENFGLGYSLSFNDYMSAGVSLRYFTQSIVTDELNLIISDTVNSFMSNTLTTNNNFWRGDFGISFIPWKNFNTSLEINNMLIINERNNFGVDDISLNTAKSVSLGLNYSQRDFFSAGANYESTGSFMFGGSFSTQLFGGIFTLGLTAYHDKYMNPFIGSLAPCINYSSDILSLSVIYIKYTSDRSTPKTTRELKDNGLHNIIHNQFSSDKIFLTLNFALSFAKQPLVKFEEVTVAGEIFPTMRDEYLSRPFAEGKVINLTGEKVLVKPASFINGVNAQIIHSPNVTIEPYDTITIPFFTIIEEDDLRLIRRKIIQAEFYLTTVNNDFDDRLQKPVLINDLNAWDGNVITLRYFVKNDYQFANEHAKKIIGGKKTLIESGGEELVVFQKIKTLFEHFAKNITYVSDPRTNVEYVQFPNETFERKGGDCDDLSVAFSALLESIGINTAFVDYKSDDGISHVNLLINTGLTPDKAGLITVNDKKYFLRKDYQGIDQVWIPLETTSLTDFETAWQTASEMFNKKAVEELGLAKNKVEIIDIY